jgi:hypothetical protein
VEEPDVSLSKAIVENSTPPFEPIANGGVGILIRNNLTSSQNVA